MPRSKWPAGPIIRFTLEEIERLQHLAKARNAAKLRHGISRSQYDRYGPEDHDDWLPHFWALKGQLAVAIHTGGRHQDDVSVRGNHRGHVLLPDGRYAFVKYRSKRGSDFGLHGETMNGFYGDIGYLVWPSGFELQAGPVELIGTITKAEFKASSYIGQFGQRSRRAVPYTALTPFGAPAAEEPTGPIIKQAGFGFDE